MQDQNWAENEKKKKNTQKISKRLMFGTYLEGLLALDILL